MYRSPRLRRSVLTAAFAAVLSAAVLAAAPAEPAEEESAVPLHQSTSMQRLIVGYEPDADAARSDNAAAKAIRTKADATGQPLSFERRLGTGAVLLKPEKRLSAEALNKVLSAFRSDPSVSYVERDTLAQPLAEPDDTLNPRQWDLFEERAGMNVPGAWERATGKQVTVAVVDTGYVAHSDLEAQIVDGYDFISTADNSRDGDGRDPNYHDPGDWESEGECDFDEDGRPAAAEPSSWHGTHVAGTIAAQTNNNAGIAGIAHGARIQPVRVLGTCGGFLSDMADGLIWASGGSVPDAPANSTPAKVVNLSLGGPDSCGNTWQDAIDGALKRGTTVVVSAGNDNQDANGHQPASCDNSITVAASDRGGDRAKYSNWGRLIEITAPGGEIRPTPEDGILSTLNTGTKDPARENYRTYQGTSMAAPHIAGLAALMLKVRPSLTPTEIDAAIKANARPLPGNCPEGCGAGLADAARTVQSLTQSAPAPPSAPRTKG